VKEFYLGVGGGDRKSFKDVKSYKRRKRWLEIDPNEGRVAASPETVKRLKGLGFDVVVESGAGLASRIVDADFAAVGAAIGKVSDAGKADVVLKVRRPDRGRTQGLQVGRGRLAAMDPYGNDAAVAAMAKAGVTAFAMEFMPRITRAQVDGRAVEPGQPRRLPGGDRRRGRI
jgi:NAD/NADP transhydrogenase alpha subunit